MGKLSYFRLSIIILFLNDPFKNAPLNCSRMLLYLRSKISQHPKTNDWNMYVCFLSVCLCVWRRCERARMWGLHRSPLLRIYETKCQHDLASASCNTLHSKISESTQISARNRQTSVCRWIHVLE